MEVKIFFDVGMIVEVDRAVRLYELGIRMQQQTIREELEQRRSESLLMVDNMLLPVIKDVI